MSPSCSVPTCGSCADANSDVHFHQFPEKGRHKVIIRNERGEKRLIDKLKAWILILDIQTPVSKSMKVCSKHFTENDYFYRKSYPSKVKFLKKNTVPSRNLPLTAAKNLFKLYKCTSVLRVMKDQLKEIEQYNNIVPIANFETVFIDNSETQIMSELTSIDPLLDEQVISDDETIIEANIQASTAVDFMELYPEVEGNYPNNNVRKDTKIKVENVNNYIQQRYNSVYDGSDWMRQFAK